MLLSTDMRFHYYEEFSFIFGKDCAQGKEAEQYDDAVEEINNQPGLDAHNVGDKHMYHENNFQPEQTPDEQTPDWQTPSEAIAGSQKRKQKIAHTLADGFKEASEQLVMHMNRDEREKRLDDMKDSLYDDIMLVEGLSNQQRDSAYVKLMSDEKLLTKFYAAPQQGKARVLRRMIA